MSTNSIPSKHQIDRLSVILRSNNKHNPSTKALKQSLTNDHAEYMKHIKLALNKFEMSLLEMQLVGIGITEAIEAIIQAYSKENKPKSPNNNPIN